MNLKSFVAVVAAGYAVYYAATAASWHFIDSVDLVIHEAGHWLFPFGEFVHVLMGSGLQILLPLVFVLYFLGRRDAWSASLILYWVGFNILNVSLYAGDAVKQQLQLLGNGEQDWHWLFSTMGVLSYTDLIASGMFALGLFVIACAGVGSFYFLEES